MELAKHPIRKFCGIERYFVRSQQECAKIMGVSRIYFQRLETYVLAKVYLGLIEAAVEDPDFSGEDIEALVIEANILMSRLNKIMDAKDNENRRQSEQRKASQAARVAACTTTE